MHSADIWGIYRADRRVKVVSPRLKDLPGLQSPATDSKHPGCRFVAEHGTAHIPALLYSMTKTGSNEGGMVANAGGTDDHERSWRDLNRVVGQVRQSDRSKPSLWGWGPSGCRAKVSVGYLGGHGGNGPRQIVPGNSFQLKQKNNNNQFHIHSS